MIDYALIWLLVIAFGVILYVILDGFSLGLGIISPLFADEHDKDLIVSTILPVWDGNETWLVFVGATLYGGFPVAFSTILPAMYMPIMIMVIALLLRGASFEFRLKTHHQKTIWNLAFFIGSLFATISQGLILGTLLVGFQKPYNNTSFTAYQWLTPFNCLCAFSLVIGYAFLGSNRLIIKTSGLIQDKCFMISKLLQPISLVCILGVVLSTIYIDQSISEIWFKSARSPLFFIVAIVGSILFILHYIFLKKRYEHLPYWLLIGLFLLAYASLLLSIFPYIIPHKLTYIEAASSPGALKFMLVGAVVMIPVLLYYTYYSYRVFRGKVSEKIGY